MEKKPSISFLIMIIVVMVVVACANTGSTESVKEKLIDAGVEKPEEKIQAGDTPTALPEDSNVFARHKNGQTFITWKERPEITGERYLVYRYSQPINAKNIQQATLLYELSEDSARFSVNRYNVDQSGVWQDRYVRNFVIEDFAEQIPEGVGLLVWTLSEVDFDGAANGSAYYALSWVDSDGNETFQPDYTFGPIEECVAEPLPVELAVDVGREGHLYIQYMDLRNWNPTFHAPNPGNQYYGLDSQSPAVANAVQYGYDYLVYGPKLENCGGELPDKVPLYIDLHGHGSNAYKPATADNQGSMGCSYGIYLVDTTETWFFGFAKEHDYRSGVAPQAGDVIVNYTEQRVLRMIYDLIRQPPGPDVDTERIYVYGHSMGASGTLAFALRYPNVFAAAYASQPMTNYRTSGDGGGTDVREDVYNKWGMIEDNIPVQIDAPHGWASHLLDYEGTGVWDWQNHQQNLIDRQGDEMVPLGVAHGMGDYVLEWPTQGEPFYSAIEKSRQLWGGVVTADEHTWMQFQGLSPNLALVDDIPFAGFTVIRSETVPGLSELSTNPSLPPTEPGFYNQTVLWSSSWYPWDGVPVDEPKQWQMSLCSVGMGSPAGACSGGVQQTVNVTPRRLQHFDIQPGKVYHWEVSAVVDGALLAKGELTADEHGLLTVPGVEILPDGSRILIVAE